MPTGIETVINGLLNQQALGIHQQSMSAALAQKQAQADALAKYRAGLEDWRDKMLALKRQQQQVGNANLQQKLYNNWFWNNRLLNTNISNEPPLYQNQIMQARSDLQNALKNDPNAMSSDLGYKTLGMPRPVPFQLKTFPMIGPNGLPATGFYDFNPAYPGKPPSSVSAPAPVGPGMPNAGGGSGMMFSPEESAAINGDGSGEGDGSDSAGDDDGFGD